MRSRETHDHLRGIVAIWLTNGNKPVDGGNETRYEMFSGGWEDAYEATHELLGMGFLAAPIDEETGPDISKVTPTAQGIFEAIR